MEWQLNNLKYKNSKFCLWIHAKQIEQVKNLLFARNASTIRMFARNEDAESKKNFHSQSLKAIFRSENCKKLHATGNMRNNYFIFNNIQHDQNLNTKIVRLNIRHAKHNLNELIHELIEILILECCAVFPLLLRSEVVNLHKRSKI